MKMPPDILTALLRGEHIQAEECASRGLLPPEILYYEEVLDHLASVISTSDYFPQEYRAHIAGEPVDEHIVIERRGCHRFVCHARRHHPLDPRQLVEVSHRRFWSARSAAANFLRWEHKLPGVLDGWPVVGNGPTSAPDVSMDDLDRIVRRDFPPELHVQVVDVLIRYGRGDGEKNRVCAAALKLAGGDMVQLEHYIDVALSDFRDVLAWAEYPAYMDCVLGPKDESEAKALIDADWQQYQAWLTK
jgi:hypothetical protein